MAVWSSVQLSKLGHAQRIEAEYYRPNYLSLSQHLEKVSAIPLLRYLAYLTDGTHVTPKYVSNGIPFLSSSDVDPFILPYKIEKFISEEEHGRLKHCQPDTNDILMSKSGRIGSCAVVPPHISRGDWNIYEGIALLRLTGISPYYATAFLNSKYGITQIRRELKGVAQPHLHLEDIRRLRIFAPLPEHETEIEDMVKRGVSFSDKSHKLYTQAQQLLESELGLDKLRFDKPVGYTARFSELELSHRTDAQHYQPRFTRLLEHLSQFPTKRIRDIRRYNRRGIQPVYVENGTHAVINSQHLGPKHINYDGLQKTTEHIFNISPEAHVQPDDLLIYTTGAYIGRTNVYLDTVPAFASNHVNILRLSPDIDHSYIAMVFQSIIGQFQTQKHARGSAQAELYPADIDKFVVPLLPPDKQQEIGNLVRESLTKQRESAQLLDQAKSRVEQLIEEAVRA
jgi:restriction endonuclease S subunit